MNAPISAIATTAPTIEYSSMAVIDDEGEDGLLNLTDIAILYPLTVKLPEVLFAEQPDAPDIVQLTDPFVRENEYVDVVIAPDFIPFERFTYHAVPEGNPDSENVTVYFQKEYAIDTDSEDPFTMNLDDLAEQFLSVDDGVK